MAEVSDAVKGQGGPDWRLHDVVDALAVLTSLVLRHRQRPHSIPMLQTVPCGHDVVSIEHRKQLRAQGIGFPDSANPANAGMKYCGYRGPGIRRRGWRRHHVLRLGAPAPSGG
jgi:hypothetical protein